MVSHRNIIVEKSENFALRIVNLYKFLIDRSKESVLSKQILRSGTSIGANIAEAKGSPSDADFINKLHISLKESFETEFWLRLLYRSEYIKEDAYESLKNDLEDLIRLLTSIIKATKKRLNTQ